MTRLFLLFFVLLGLTAPAFAEATGPQPAASEAHEADSRSLDAIGARPDRGMQAPMTLGGGGPDIPVGSYLIQLVVVTGVVGGLGYLTLNFLKNKVPGMGLGLAAGKQIKVIDKVMVDPKRMVFMVNVGNRYFLMAATEGQVTPVAELSKADLGGEFAQLLEQERTRGEAV